MTPDGKKPISLSELADELKKKREHTERLAKTQTPEEIGITFVSTSPYGARFLLGWLCFCR